MFTCKKNCLKRQSIMKVDYGNGHINNNIDATKTKTYNFNS